MPEVAVRFTQIAVKRGFAGRGRYGALNQFDCVLKLSGLQMHNAEQMQRIGVALIGTQDLAIGLLRDVVPTRLVVRHRLLHRAMDLLRGHAEAC